MKVTDNRAGSRAGFVSQRFGSEDPGPYQHVRNPEHWFIEQAGEALRHNAAEVESADKGQAVPPASQAC